MRRPAAWLWPSLLLMDRHTVSISSPFLHSASCRMACYAPRNARTIPLSLDCPLSLRERARVRVPPACIKKQERLRCCRPLDFCALFCSSEEEHHCFIRDTRHFGVPMAQVFLSYA